jgi:N-acetylmuramic acid 6-phosphate etherase
MGHIGELTTEASHPGSLELDTMRVPQLLQLMNDEDGKVPAAVRAALPAIAGAVDLITSSLRRGGRLIYVGAGTSGRLGVLDAAECPPTFSTPPGQVVGLIAGGEIALTQAVEGAEDSPQLAEQDLRAVEVDDHDVVVGLTASGRTPYVLAGVRFARSVGASTVSVACNTGSQVSALVDIAIEVDTGPEILTGSTRLKAGTSQKLVINMLSTSTMIQMGKVYGNLMVDVSATNAKLVTRAHNIIIAATGVDAATAQHYYRSAAGRTKIAIVMILAEVDDEEAERRLAAAGGLVRRVLHP